MRTSEVAKAAGVNLQTLRYYERRGLLPEPARRASGYREYEPNAVQQVRFIKRAQDLGFTLDEILELLDLRDGRGRARSEVRALATAKIGAIDDKLQRLGASERPFSSLSKLVSARRTQSAVRS